jgi:hypothetical protein
LANLTFLATTAGTALLSTYQGGGIPLATPTALISTLGTPNHLLNFSSNILKDNKTFSSVLALPEAIVKTSEETRLVEGSGVKAAAILLPTQGHEIDLVTTTDISNGDVAPKQADVIPYKKKKVRTSRLRKFTTNIGSV